MFEMFQYLWLKHIYGSHRFDLSLNRCRFALGRSKGNVENNKLMKPRAQCFQSAGRLHHLRSYSWLNVVCMV